MTSVEENAHHRTCTDTHIQLGKSSVKKITNMFDMNAREKLGELFIRNEGLLDLESVKGTF